MATPANPNGHNNGNDKEHRKGTGSPELKGGPTCMFITQRTARPGPLRSGTAGGVQSSSAWPGREASALGEAGLVPAKEWETHYNTMLSDG
jgi:hypothetical protein